ncbi:unnamed protein product, partial [Brassica rapa subsp. trilocularis]
IASISSPVSSLLLQNKSAELEVTTKNVLVKVLIADAVWSVYGESELPSYGVSTESMVFYLCVGYSTSDLMLRVSTIRGFRIWLSHLTRLIGEVNLGLIYPYVSWVQECLGVQYSHGL